MRGVIYSYSIYSTYKEKLKKKNSKIALEEKRVKQLREIN